MCWRNPQPFVFPPFDLLPALLLHAIRRAFGLLLQSLPLNTIPLAASSSFSSSSSSHITLTRREAATGEIDSRTWEHSSSFPHYSLLPLIFFLHHANIIFRNFYAPNHNNCRDYNGAEEHKNKHGSRRLVEPFIDAGRAVERYLKPHHFLYLFKSPPQGVCICFWQKFTLLSLISSKWIISKIFAGVNRGYF